MVRTDSAVQKPMGSATNRVEKRSAFSHQYTKNYLCFFVPTQT